MHGFEHAGQLCFVSCTHNIIRTVYKIYTAGTLNSSKLRVHYCVDIYVLEVKNTFHFRTLLTGWPHFGPGDPLYLSRGSSCTCKKSKKPHSLACSPYKKPHSVTKQPCSVVKLQYIKWHLYYHSFHGTSPQSYNRVMPINQLTL